MTLESVTLKNFKCFGPKGVTVSLDKELSVFIGNNGSGKTALVHGLLRMFGVTADLRRVRRQDFHISQSNTETDKHNFSIEVILSFPETLDKKTQPNAIPQFFNQMASEESGTLKCRLRFEADLIEDGTAEGLIETRFFAIKTLDKKYKEDQCVDLSPADKTRIQMIYVPASRDGVSQMTAFLKGRLWKAIDWSSELRDTVAASGKKINKAFESEVAIKSVSEAVKKRWQNLHFGGTDAEAIFRPIDVQFSGFIKNVEVAFHPDEAGQDRNINDLSDGQRSLFHIALTAATLDIEDSILRTGDKTGFRASEILLPALTIIAIEEPENNLSPFFLSRIISEIIDTSKSNQAQAVLSSHSASILARIEPEQVRYFQIPKNTREATVNSIVLPVDEEDASKYVREAVRTFPELYFAKYVILGEGSSEEIVIPRIAEAMDVHIDRSFIAIVPLGGRHVNHLWRLLTSLNIPYATLLDADCGREGGGWRRIKTVLEQLIANGVKKEDLIDTKTQKLKDFSTFQLKTKEDKKYLTSWLKILQENHNIFFCYPLDLDWIMLQSLFPQYTTLLDGALGPRNSSEAKQAVLGENGDGEIYASIHDEKFMWYRYLFLGRSKPGTHMRVLSQIKNEELEGNIPRILKALIDKISSEVFS